MAMTKLEMVTEACNVAGKSLNAIASSGETLQTRAGRFLNFAQRRVAMVTNFWELQSLCTTAATVDSVYEYPLETGTNNLGLSNVKSIASIRLIDGENSRKLERKDYRTLDAYIPYPNNYTTDRPTLYIRRGNTLYLFRIPNDAYDLHIRYNKWASDLNTDAATSDFENKDDIIVAATVVEIFLAHQEFEAATVWSKVVVGKLQQITNAEADLEDADMSFDSFNTTPPYSGIGAPWTSPWGDVLAGYE